MSYEPVFDPGDLATKRGDRPKGRVEYLYDDDTLLAVNVALATERPLLLSGDPGCGKSSLAADVAWLLDRRYEDRVITSRTQGQDLKWKFDAVRRLADVQAIRPGKPVVLEDKRYVEPGVLWRAFNFDVARGFGLLAAAGAALDARPGVVALIDEIDKADPDLPNDLLVTLDERRFTVDDIGLNVRAPADLKLLVVITTNGERDLPPAFIRRCVAHRMPNPKGARVVSIGKSHFPDAGDTFLKKVEETMSTLAEAAAKDRRREPSVAEFLDAVRALRKLRVTDPESPDWKRVTDATMLKTDRVVASRT